MSPLDLDQTDADVKFFDEHGYVVVRDVLSSAELAAIEAAADEVMARGDTLVESADDYHKARDCLGLDPRFRPMLANERILARLVRLLSPDIHLVSSQLIYFESRPPDHPRVVRTPEQTGWHQDIHGLTEDLHGRENVPRVAVKCAYYFTDVRAAGSGMTMFMPGSHLLTEPIRIPDGAIDPVGAVTPVVDPGDVVLFENRTWHASGLNTCGTTRKCMMMQYSYRWFKPVNDATLGPLFGFDYSTRVPPDASAVERQLLDALTVDPGRKRHRDDGYRPLLDWSRARGLTGPA